MCTGGDTGQSGGLWKEPTTNDNWHPQAIVMEEYYQRYAGINMPKSKLLSWTKQGLCSFFGPPAIVFPPETSEAIKIQPDPSLTSSYNVKKPPIMSHDGGLVSFICENGDILILSTEDGEQIATVSCPHAEYVEFSPQCTYFVTWSRPTKQQDGTNGNLKVWRTESGVCVATFSHRTQKRGVIQWNNDESVCIKLGTNELAMYAMNVESGKLERSGKCPVKGLSQFSVSPVAASPFVAVFTPETSGKPAKLSMLRYCVPLSDAEGTEPFCDVGVSRSLFSASQCSIFWNPRDCSSILVQTHRSERVRVCVSQLMCRCNYVCVSDVDSSGGSYYGASGLFLVSVDGVVSRPVPQSKDGHVYSVQWAPDGSSFITAAGRMPCHVTLFSPQGEPVYEFGALYRDTICWAPHGRFLCLAGFGNLGGAWVCSAFPCMVLLCLSSVALMPHDE